MQFKKNESLEADLLIVGSGPAASVYAAKASIAGKKVIMLEVARAQHE